MIIFGTRTKLLKAFGSQQTCGHCHAGNLNVAYTISYFHIFWIPMFPLGKKGMTQCPHCKQTLTEREVGPQGQSYCKRKKEMLKRR